MSCRQEYRGRQPLMNVVTSICSHILVFVSVSVDLDVTDDWLPGAMIDALPSSSWSFQLTLVNTAYPSTDSVPLSIVILQYQRNRPFKHFVVLRDINEYKRQRFYNVSVSNSAIKIDSHNAGIYL